MDKQTLSNYGWVIILTLVLAVMLALATPFGTYVGDGVVSIVRGYTQTSDTVIDEENISAKSQQWENILYDKTLFFGDVNQDGTVNSDDGVLVLQYTQFPDDYLPSGMTKELFERIADVNMDGFVTDADAEMISSHSSTFPAANVLYGDFNGDGKITNDDSVAVLYFSYFSNYEDFLPTGMSEEEAVHFLDVNLDGLVTDQDAVTIESDAKKRGDGKTLPANKVY